MELVTVIVKRSWAGVTNGMKLTMRADRAQRLLAMRMVEPIDGPRRRRKPKADPVPDDSQNEPMLYG